MFCSSNVLKTKSVVDIHGCRPNFWIDPLWFLISPWKPRIRFYFLQPPSFTWKMYVCQYNIFEALESFCFIYLLNTGNYNPTWWNEDKVGYISPKVSSTTKNQRLMGENLPMQSRQFRWIVHTYIHDGIKLHPIKGSLPSLTNLYNKRNYNEKHSRKYNLHYWCI